jgi:sugar lactone lactonase YvrE
VRSEIEGKFLRSGRLRRTSRVALTTVVGLLSVATTSLIGTSSAVASPPPPLTKPGEIIAVAGGGPVAVPTSGIPALYAHLSNPSAVAVDSSGDVFIADTDDNEVKEVTPHSEIYVIAGNGIAGRSGNGGLATSAELDHPEGVAVDSSGDVFIADTGNNEVREIIDGDIYDFAGNGTAGYSGDGDAPVDAELNAPYGVAVDPYGDVAIADTNNDVVRLVYRQFEVNTASRPAASPEETALRQLLPGWVSEAKGAPHLQGETLRIVTFAGGGSTYGDGGPATSGQLILPTAVAFDPGDDNLYIADTGNSAIRDVNLDDDDISTAAYAPYPTGVAADANDDLVIADPEENEVLFAAAGSTGTTRLAGDILPGGVGDGGPSKDALLDEPSGVALDQYGDVFVADTSNSVVREIVAARAPVFVTETPPLIIGADGAYAYHFVAVGVPEPTYSLDGAPSWLSINATTGAVSGTLPSGVRSFSYAVSAENSSGGATAGEFTVTVPAAPSYVDSSETGALKGPTGIGADSAGDIWIADTGVNRIEEESAKAAVLKNISEYDGTKTWHAPNGVALSGTNIWVADSGNNKVEEISTTTGALEFATPAGELSDPKDVVVSPDGNVYIADTGANKIVVLSSNGSLLGSVGSAGHGVGQFESPIGLAVGANLDLYVADSGNKRIVKMTSGGSYITAFSGVATGFKTFVQPEGVFVDAAGDIWVTDRLDNTVTELSTTGVPALQLRKSGTSPGELNGPVGIEVSPSGVISVADTTNNRLDQFQIPIAPTFTTDSPPLRVGTGSDYYYTFAATGLPAPRYALAAGAPAWLGINATTGALAGTVPSGITTFTYSVTATNAAGTATAGPFTVTVTLPFTPVFYADTFAPGQVSTGMAEDSSGNLWIANQSINQIDEYSSTGQFLQSFGTSGSTPGDLDSPTGLAIYGNDLYVANFNFIDEFNISNSPPTLVRDWGSVGTGTGQFADGGAIGVAIDGSGNVWVSDYGNSRIEEFSASGSYKSQIDDQDAYGMAFDSSGDLVVANGPADEIEVLSTSGTVSQTISGAGTGAGAFDDPWGVTVDSSGNIWFTDVLGSQVLEYSSTGVWLQTVTNPGGLSEPEFLSVDSTTGIVTVGAASSADVEQFAPATAPRFIVDTPPGYVSPEGSYTYTFFAFGAPAPAYSLASGAPAWLSVNATTGAVSGTLPSGATPFTYSVVATNASGSQTAGPFTVVAAS